VAIATFAIVSLVDGPGDARGDLSNYRGLARRNPVLASAFALLLLSQLGVPLTVGFVAKFNALAAVIDQGGAWMAVVAMLAAATAAVAYLRWATSLFASSPALESALDVPLSTKVVVAVGVAVTLIGGVDPTWFAWIAQHASLAYLP
jgi:NADH-quinone oxidoreductase subunit N